MIRIDRTRAVAPPDLLTDGPTERDQVIRPKAIAGTLGSSDFKGSVYGSKPIKEALWEMQDGKCCFCEKEVEVAFGTVEHFRPKTSAREDDGSTRPGYWWLGYEMENLYLCCSNCNTPKGNYFPLAAGAAPLAVDVLASGAAPPEAALILDPGFEDPEPHLAWVFLPGKGMQPAGLTDRGKATVRAAKLDARDELTKFRGRHYRKFLVPLIAKHRAAQQAGDAAALAQVVADAQLLAERDSPYAGMTRAVLRQAGIL